MSSFRRRLMSGGSKPYDAEVQYVQSSGTQGFDTGITPTANTMIRIKFCNLEATGDLIFGYRLEGDDTHDFRFFNYLNRLYWDGFGGSRIYIQENNVINSGYTYWLEFGNNYVKDITTDRVLISGTAYSGTAEDTIKICGPFNADPENPTFSKNRISAFQVIENGVLIADYISVRKRGVGELYDKVTGTFATKTGSGDWVAGPDKITYDSEVDYIESTGTQFIDTGIDFYYKETVTQLDMMLTKDITGTCVLMGAFTDNSTGDAVSKEQLAIVNGTLSAQTAASTLCGGTHWAAGSRYLWSFRGYSNTDALRTDRMHIYIFARNSDHDAYLPTDGMRVFSSRMFIKGLCVRDYIPVRVGQTAHIYDKITGTFATELGSGTWLYGNDKSELNVIPVKWISNNTSTYGPAIDLEIFGGARVDISMKFTPIHTVRQQESWTGIHGSRVNSSSSERDTFQYWQKSNGDFAILSDFRSFSHNKVIQSGQTITLKRESGVSSINGTVFGNGNENTLFRTSYPCALFGFNENGRIYQEAPWTQTKLESYEARQFGVPVRKIIGVRIGQTAYIYDKLHGRLFDKVGTADFLYEDYS